MPRCTFASDGIANTNRVEPRTGFGSTGARPNSVIGPSSTPAPSAIANAAFERSCAEFNVESRAVTRRNAFVVAGPVTFQLNEPEFAIAAAMDSNGPPAPVRLRSRSTFFTFVLSDAVHVSDVFAATFNTSPPFGAVTATVGAWMSVNVDVTLLSASMSRLLGFVLPVRSPPQAENAQPLPGTAVSCTLEPFT